MLAAGGQASAGGAGGGAAASCAFAVEEATVFEAIPGAFEVVIPEVEAFAGIEVAEGVVLEGAEIEAWLLAEGEIGGEVALGSVGSNTSGFGLNALWMMEESSIFENIFLAANRDLPIALRLELAARFAFEKLGLNIYRWL